MKKIFLTALIITLFCGAAFLPAQVKAEKTKRQAQTEEKSKTQTGRFFVDKNGDGYNDNAPDHDGDGIPNCIDPDFKGSKMQKGKRSFVDKDGDGIDDNNETIKKRTGKTGYGTAKGYGKGNNLTGKGKGKSN
jgi:hypothetical protein